MEASLEKGERKEVTGIRKVRERERGERGSLRCRRQDHEIGFRRSPNPRTTQIEFKTASESPLMSIQMRNFSALSKDSMLVCVEEGFRTVIVEFDYLSLICMLRKEQQEDSNLGCRI